MDIGTGSGGILDELSVLASGTVAVEPQKVARESLKKIGYDVYSSIEEVVGSDFEIVTLFHVFEHFTDPLDELRSISKKIVSGGKIIIEVPHADDFLLSWINIKKRFSFGSSTIFNNAFSEFMFKFSTLSIKTNLGLLLKLDLFA